MINIIKIKHVKQHFLLFIHSMLTIDHCQDYVTIVYVCRKLTSMATAK